LIGLSTQKEIPEYFSEKKIEIKFISDTKLLGFSSFVYEDFIYCYSGYDETRNKLSERL